MAFSEGPAVFAVLAGNYQRRIAPSPRESSISDGSVAERTARYPVVGAHSSARACSALGIPETGQCSDSRKMIIYQYKNEKFRYRGAGKGLRSGILAYPVPRSDRRPRSDKGEGCGADHLYSGATPAASDDGLSSEAPNGSCASGAACGARIWKGRSRCFGDGVVKLRPPARKAKRRAAAPIKQKTPSMLKRAIKLVPMSGPITEPNLRPRPGRPAYGRAHR